MDDTRRLVFISYSRHDPVGVDWSRRILERLSELGISAWRDDEGILAGDMADERIEAALEQAAAMIVVVSETLKQRPWTRHEVAYAQELGIRIIPVEVDVAHRRPIFMFAFTPVEFHRDEEVGWTRLTQALNGLRVAADGADAPTPDEAESLTEPHATPVSEPPPAPGVSSEQRQLLDKLNDPGTPPARRLEIGDRLAEIGDPRPGVGLDERGLPDIDWVVVPAGPFNYGDGKTSRTRKLETFHLARYAVTNAQYDAFIEAGGYDDDRWWHGLARRIEAPEPGEWSIANRPRETVSWYEAVAFCRWLSERLGYEVRLPSEVEWEKGARGEDGRAYPWGSEYRSGYANVDETETKSGPHYLRQTTAVGVYPQGESPYGLADMAGNVWEWTADWIKIQDNPNIFDDYFAIIRGGDYFNRAPNIPSRLAAETRSVRPFSLGPSTIGFRCAQAARTVP
ncbi:MAG: SUMF1/EgtB/PvdO family nonheme iron enzyme [Gammaproteobacteria bacterium]|nr:SUMF1/EgtB/PvdO family nonheme iron enzyme [Gammaproteobacteria bacterium]